jgi:hypothetical protein
MVVPRYLPQETETRNGDGSGGRGDRNTIIISAQAEGKKKKRLRSWSTNSLPHWDSRVAPPAAAARGVRPGAGELHCPTASLPLRPLSVARMHICAGRVRTWQAPHSLKLGSAHTNEAWTGRIERYTNYVHSQLVRELGWYPIRVTRTISPDLKVTEAWKSCY